MARASTRTTSNSSELTLGAEQTNRYRRLAIALVLVGVACRLVEYLWRTSYWGDEAVLVLNIINKGFLQLLGPLDDGQAAPPLFLWIERGLYLLCGSSEYALRLLPLLVLIASVPLFAHLAWRTLSPLAAAWAIAFYALCDRFIPVFVKQHSAEAATAVFLFWLAFAWGGKRTPAMRLLVLSAASAILLWFSLTASIIFAAISLALLPACLRQGRRGVPIYLLGNVVVLLSFALLYWFSIRLEQTPYLHGFWLKDHAFPDWSHPLRFPLWLITQIYEVANYPYPQLGILALALATMGLAGWRRGGKHELAITVIASFALTVLAACVHQYPLAGKRVILFLMPGLFLAMGAAIEWLRQVLSPPARRFWWVVPTPLAALGIGLCAHHLFIPRAESTIRPVVRYVQAHRAPGQVIFSIGDNRHSDPRDPILGRAKEIDCYWPQPDAPIYYRLSTPADLPATPFWVILSLQPGATRQDQEIILKPLRAVADELDHYANAGAAAALFAPHGRPTTQHTGE